MDKAEQLVENVIWMSKMDGQVKFDRGRKLW